jgi:hypothetical protein
LLSRYQKKGGGFEENKDSALNILNIEDMDPEKIKVLHDITDKESDKYFYNGAPLLSAASHLSIHNTKDGIIKLIRGNEIFLAFLVGTFTKSKHMDELNYLMAARAQKLKNE